MTYIVRLKYFLKENTYMYHIVVYMSVIVCKLVTYTVCLISIIIIDVIHFFYLIIILMNEENNKMINNE